MSRMRLRPISARALSSPRNSLHAASSPAPLVSGPLRLWYPQRIFSRVLWRRLRAAVRLLTSSRR